MERAKFCRFGLPNENGPLRAVCKGGGERLPEDRCGLQEADGGVVDSPAHPPVPSQGWQLGVDADQFEIGIREEHDDGVHNGPQEWSSRSAKASTASAVRPMRL